MTKSYHFFKNRLESVLDENTFCKLWDFLDYWIFNNAWIPILFIVFLGVAFEIILVRTCEFFKKKLELWENGSLGSQKQNEDGFPKGMTFATESWSITHSSSAERVETLSGQVTTTHPSEENGDNTSDRVFSSDDCEFQGSHFYESYSSSGGTSASLSMFHSEVKKIFVSHRKEPQREYQAIQISSNNLFSIMKTNSTKSTFPDDLRFQNPFKTTRDKDLNVAPCPPVHLFLSSNQIRHVEENIRRRIPVNPTATLVREVDYLHHTSQEPSIHNQYSNEVVIPVEEQDTFLNQNVIQNQMIHEAQFTSQIQQFIHNQESFSSQPGFAQPPDFIKMPFSSSTQDLFQAQDRDRKEKSQHFIHIPCIVGTQDSTRGIESDESFSETQYSVYFSDPKEINYLVKGQNSVFQNAEFLSLSPKSSAEAVPQQKGMPESHQPIPSLDSNQYDACNSMSLKPTIKRQRNKKKIPDNERKLNLKVPSSKAKKMSCSQVFPNIVCHTLEKKIELRPKKKKIVYQRKIMAVIALHLISISKLITYHVKKYFLKNLVMVIPDVMKHEHFLQEQNGSPDTEKISFTSSTDRGSMGVIENLEHSFAANTDELAAPCSLFETNGEKKESSEDSVQQAFDLNIPKHEGHLEMLSESSQKDVLFPNTELNRRMKVQKNGQTTENVDELTVSIPNTQRCFPKDKIQQAKNSMEIILNFSGINSLIALGSQQQEKNELKDITFQIITGSINLKEEEPLMTSITEYGKPSDSEKLECNTRTNKKNRHQDERMSETSENATEATISEPFDMELCSRLKAKADTPTINCSHSALKQEKLLDKKKIQEVEHPDKGSICRKPEKCDRERKERETVPSLADFRVIICLKQKDKCVQFKMEQIQSENRTIQSEEKEEQPRTSSTQTVWKTSSSPSTDPLQVEKIKQRTVKPTDKEWSADPMRPSLVPENLPIGEYLIKTTECRVPFSGYPTETLDGHIPEDKEDLKKDLCAVAIRPFKTRKKSSGTKNVLSVRHRITKVKKPAFFLRFCITPYDTLNHKRKIGDSFESIIKQMLHNAILAHGLLNVHPHRYLIPNKKANIKIIPPKPQVEKKGNSLDVLTKESKAVDTLEVQLCCGMKVLKQAQPEVAAQRKRSFGCDALPLEESETEKQVFQAVSFKEAIKTIDSLRMDSFSVANRKNSTSTQTELKFSEELELVPPTSEKLAMGDSLSQSRESNILNSGNDTREISCSFTQKVFLWSLNYYMPVLTHSKKKKDRTKFTNTSAAKFKFMNKIKPPASKTFNITSNKKSKLDHKTKFKKINQAKALLPECQNTVCLSIHSRLQGGFCYAQLKQRELANKTCVFGIAESSAIHDREKNLQEEKQAALCHGQHLWAGADQSKDTLFNDPDPSLISLSQEQLVKTQSVKCQKDFLQSTLEATLQIDPTESEGLQKTTKTENDIKFPVVPKILSPKAGNSSPSEFTNMTDDDLEFDKNSESELDSYPVEKDSETSINLQSSDSFTRSFVSRPKRMRKAPRSKKKIPVNQRRRAMGEIKPSWTVNLRYSKKLKQNKEMKGPQQKCNIEVACLDVIHSNVHILPNKNIRNSKTWTGEQRIRFGHMQLTQEKSPNERSAQCPDSADASSSSSLKNYKEEKKEKLEDFLVSENSPGLIFDMYQEKDHDLVSSYKQLDPRGRATTQVQPQTPTEAILYSTTCPIPEELQLEKLQGCFSMFPLKVGNAKDKALSEKQCDLSNERLHKEQAGNSEKEAKELSVSYTNPDYRGEMKCDSTEMQGMNQEKKIADEPSSSSNVALDINISSKIEIGKGTLREKTLHSIQMKAETLHHEETITTDDIKEIDIQNKEEEKKNDNTLLKSLPQDSQHFAYCSYQSRGPKSHKLGKQRGRNILSIVERSITKKNRWADITRREYDMYISNSKLPPLKPGDSQINKINTDRTKYERPADGTHAQELNSWDRVERKGLKNYLQATIPEILNLTTSDVPKSKRQSKVSTCKALQGKMCSTGVTMKGRKTSVSKVLTIPQCSQRKNLLPKTLKSQISGLLTHSDVLPDILNIIILKDPTAEKNKRLLTQELTATMLESLGFSTPISKERENFKFMDKKDEMSTNCVTVKASKTTVFQTLIPAGCGTPKQSKPMAGSSLNAIFSPMPMSLNVSAWNGVKDEDITWTVRFSRELPDQSVHEERTCHTHSTEKDNTSNDTKDVKGEGDEKGPLTSQHFSFSSQNTAGLNSVQSDLQLVNSATWPELEKLLYDGQAQPVNVNNLQSSMVGVMSPLLNLEESQVGPIPHNNTWDGNPRIKCDYLISEQKAWTQRGLTALEPSSMSPEYKCESCTLEFPGKRDVSPRARQVLRLLNITRGYTGFHRKKRHYNSKHHSRNMGCVGETLLHAAEDAVSCPLKFLTGELSLDTAAKADFYSRIPQKPMAKGKAKLQANFATTFLGPYNFFIPVLFDFERQVNIIKLSESEIMLNQRFSTRKRKKPPMSTIIKINRYFITNHKKLKLRRKMKVIWLSEKITDIPQSTVHIISTISNRKSKFEAEVSLRISKFTQTQPTHGESPVEAIAEYDDSVDRGENNIQVILENPHTNVKKSHKISEPAHRTTKHGKKKTGLSCLKEKSLFYLTGIATLIAKHLVASKEFKNMIGSMSISNLSAYKGIPKQIPGSMDSQLARDGSHAALKTNVAQDFRTPEIKENCEVNTDIKSIYTCMPIQHIKTESSHNIWDMYGKSTKGNDLLQKDKAKMKRKGEFEQPILFTIASQSVQPFGADQKKQPDPFKPEAFSANTVHHKDITLQKTAIYFIDQVGEELSKEVALSSDVHTLQIGRQNKEFKTDWKTKSKSFALPKKQAKPTISGPTWSSYASETTDPETVRQKNKAKISNVKSTMCVKQIKLKAKKIPAPLLGHGDRSNKKELGHSIQHQNSSELRRNGQNLVLKVNFDLGCLISPVEKLTRVKLEKAKLKERKNILSQTVLEKPSNQRQASWSGCVDVSRNLEEHIKKAHDHCTLKDIHQQFMQQFWVKSEHPCKLEDLQRKMNSELPSQKDETDNLALDTSRARGGTNIYSDYYRMTNQFLRKQDITPSGLEKTGGLNITDKPLESKESSLSPKLMVQQQNLSTDPLLGSISSHVPHQPHTEEPEEDMKISDKILKNSTQQLKKLSSEEYISGMDYMPKSIEKLLLLIKEQEKRRKKSRGSKKIEITEDIKTRAQFINTTKNNGMFRQREEPNRSMATLWRQQRWCVQGISLDYVYTDEFTSKVIQQNKKTTAFMESVMYHKRVKMKVRRTASGRLLNITGYGTHSYRKELRHSINTEKELPQEKTVADLLWKNFCYSDYIASQIKTLTEIKEGKGKPQRLKKMNKTKMLSVQSLDNNSISSTIRKSTQYIRKLKEHQMVLLDIIPQNKDQLMTGQQVEELRHINIHAHLEKEAYRVVFPDTGESDYSGLEDQRHRAGTEFEFSTTQRIKQGVLKDPIKHAFSAPPRRGEPKKTNISSSKGHDRFLMELDTFQKKTCKVQELLEQETTSRIGLGPVTCPVSESFDLENAKVPKEVGMYHSIKNISHLSGREGLRKTDTELGSKVQAFICTDLDDLHKTGIPQRDSSKSDHRPRIVLNSVHCHKRAPLHTTPALLTAKKGSGYSAKGVKMDLMGKEEAEPADSQLKLNRQKVDISKKLQEKQLTIFTQNKEKILEVCLSCILHQLQAKNTQKQISAKAVLSSNAFNTVVEKTSSELNIGEADWQESACKAFPMSNTNSWMDIHRITPPQVKKPLKAIENLNYHSLNTENREEKKRIQGQKDKRVKGQNQQSPSFSLKNLKKPIPCSQNYSYVQAHLEPLTKKPLSEVGKVSGMTKGLDLPSKDQLRTMCECRPKRIFPGVIQEQTKRRDTVLPLESDSKTTNCPSLLLSKRKQSSDGIQVSKSVSNDSSSMLRVSTKSLPHKASEKKQEEIDLPKLFLHCLSIYMQFLYENEKQKGNRVMKDTIWPKGRVLNVKKLEHPCSSSTDYTPSNKAEPQCYKKEKMIYVKHRQDKSGSVVIKACDPIPLPHFKLEKEKIDVLISSNVRQEKHKSQEEKNGIKEGKMKGIIDSNITLKIKESLSYPSHEKKLTLLFNTINQGRVQEELSKSDMKQTKSFILLPSLPHTNLNSRIRVGKDKSRLLKSCLPPLKPLLSLNSRKVPSSQAFNGDNLDNLMELKYLPQKKEYRNNILDLKDIIGYIHIAQKGKKPPFKCLFYEKEPWRNNKIPKNIRGNKNTLNVVQNKPWESVPSPPYLECNPKIMEAYLQRITKFCLRSPAVLESSGAIEMCKEPTDSILSSFEKAKCRPLKDRLQIASNEVMHSRKLFLRQKCSSASQELQFNVEERAKKMQEDKQIKNWNKSFISSLPYSEADTKINGEETIQIRTQSFSDHSKLQRPSDIGERIHKKSTFEPVLNNVKHSMEHEVQEREERTKTEKNIHLKEKSLISQKIQLDINEPVQELQNIKEKLNVVVTNASTWTSSYEQTNTHEKLRHTQERKCKLGESLTLTSLPYKLDTEIEVKKETWVETRSFSPYSESVESSDAEKINYAASSLNDISDSKRSRFMLYKEDGKNTFERSIMNPEVKHVNIKKSLLSCVPKIERFKMNFEEQSKKEEGSKEKVMLLRETYPAITSSDVSKLDIAEEVETEIMQSHVPYSVLQKSLPIGQAQSTKTIDNYSTKRKLYPPWKEEEVQTSVIDSLMHPRGPIFKTKISAPPQVSRVNKHSTLSKKKTHRWSCNEKTRPIQKRARYHNVVATKSDASVSVAIGHIASTKQIAKCAKRRKQDSEQEEVQTPLLDGSTYCSGIVLKANISAPTHVFLVNEHSTSMRNSEEKTIPKHDKVRQPTVFATKIATSMPSSDTRMNEQKNLLGEIQISILLPKIQDVSVSDQKVCMESSGYVLRNRKEPTQEEEKNRLKKYVKDNMMPTSIDEKVKNLPRSHTLTIKELQRKTQEKNFVDLANTIVELSISQLQLKKLSGSQLADREVYSEIKLLKEYMPQKEKVGKEKHVVMNSIVRPMNIYLKIKKSPTLHVQNLSDLQWKTRGQGEKVKEDGSKPDVTLTKKLAKISTAMPPQPILTLNTGIKEVCTPVLKRSSVFIGYLQKPTDSKEGIYVQPITRHTSINLQNEKQHMSKEKEAGVQIANILTNHKYQEMKVQKLKDEQDLILTEFPLSPDLPHPKLYEKIEYNNTKQRLRNSALQRISTEKKTVPREAIVGDSMKDVKKKHMYQREETYRKEMTDRRGTDVTLKSRKSALSQKLHRTELHMHIKPLKSKKLDEGVSEPRILRKMYTSRSTTMCRGVQVDEERLENKPSFLLPQMVPALSDAEKMTDREDTCDHVRKEKQYEKHVKEAVDLTVGVHCTAAQVSSISHLLNAKEFVLNMKVLEKKIYKNKSELAVVTSRTFMSIPSAASRCSQDETQKGTAGFTKSSYPHTIKATVHDLLLKQARPQKSKCTTSPQRISEHRQVESECESASPYHKIDLTRLSTIKGEEMLDMFIKGQKDQPEKCGKEPSTKIGNWEKKETKDNLSHKAKPKFPVSPPKKSLKETLITSDTPVYSKVFVTEREQETGLGKSYRPKKDRQSNATISKMLTPEKTSLEKLSIVRVSKSQRKEEQNVIMKVQGTSLSKSRQQLKSESFPFLNLPVHSRNQRTPLQTDVEKKHVVCISSQIESGVHMSTTEFITTRRKKDSPSIVPEQEQCDLALSQKSHDSLLKSRHLEEKDETNTVSNVNLKQKKLVMDNNSTVIQKKRKFKTDRSRGINLGEDKREMQKSCTINLENKAREKTSSTTRHVLSPGTEELQNKSQVVTPKKKNYPAQEKLKKELDISTVKQNLQEQKFLQTIIIDLLSTCIPICLKSQKNRFTVTNLKREMKPKYLTMRIPKHPISKMLGITGCGSPSNKKKLEYAFNKPKTMVPSSKDTSLGIIIRSLYVSKISPPYNEGTVHSKTNLKRENRVCHSKFQEKLPDARKIKDIITIQGEAAPETLPTTLQDKNNESKTLAEHLFPAYKALKSVFEYPVENKIQNQGLSEILEQVGAYQPGDAKASSLLEGPDTSSETYATLLCTPLLKQLTPEFKNKLPMHLVSKATEIKLNQLPEMVNISLQKCNSHPQRAISEDYSCSLYQKHTEKKFKSPKVDTIQANLKNNYQDVHPLSCVKTTTNVSSSSMMVSMVKTKPKAIEKQESVTSLATLSNLPQSHILHKFSEKEKEDLLAHLCAKTVEIQTIGLPGIVVQSYAIANAQDKSKPLFKCIHPATKGPKQTNRVLVLFNEKSFCEIDCDLQYKYLQSLPKPLTVISRPNALSKPTAKLSVDSGSEYIKVEASEESSTHSFDKELLHVSFLKQNAQEKSLPSRKFQKSTNVPAFFPGLEGTEQNDIILSDLKLEMTTERDKECHVWFQETNSYKHSVSGTQQNTAGLSDSNFDDGISDDGIDIPLNTETSTDVVECPAPEVSDSEECVFIETNFCLTQDSQELLFEVPKGIPLTNIHKVNEATYLKPFYSEDPNDNTRICRKHTSPCYQFKNNRKCRSNSKMQPSDWPSHSSANTIEIESKSSSITFSKAKHWTTTTWSRTSYSLTSSTTESNIKLSLTKKHGKSHMYPQIKERRKAKSDLWRKSQIYQSSDCSHSHGEKKQARKKRLYHCESKESNSQTNQMPEPNSHWQNIKFYSERRGKQPFFYVCVPADSMDVIPQTIRWVVPPNILQKRHFQIPQVANISNSCNRWSSSKKFLDSLAGAFNTVRYGLIPVARGCS
ncbi:leucine-rich repeat transmembrane protein CCDC168 [Psammomys obesus]|uniref:leucine-rich repeat transmembrane protein CCDC168 n=1 Tax=Psammomys obesus TaxID=48139 RepID=UPI00245317DF|nr:leucine-rich repeat transmembrane protein CCDC168 [Psammomys obesus]